MWLKSKIKDNRASIKLDSERGKNYNIESTYRMQCPIDSSLQNRKISWAEK